MCRLLWFGFGFTAAYAYRFQSVSHDVKAQRSVLNYCCERVGALEKRISEMESFSPKHSSTPSSPSDKVIHLFFSPYLLLILPSNHVVQFFHYTVLTIFVLIMFLLSMVR
ncbi:hypothetical protein V8G54_003265 [Vigna mungo]|uniref:Uncharacterized protein n=1 Tax=Vigna mungo TaxID=3915 RepID=A0AAQ3SDL8_VIGMU